MRSIAALMLALLSLAANAARAEETCVQCHRGLRDPRLRAPADELPNSVHGGAGLTCSACHHGRPDEPSAKAHDPRAGFRARAAAADPELVCGKCHAETARAAGVPTDQLALYRTSVHGAAFAKGNARAATCASCHGSHAVRKVSDPLASVNVRNVASTCGGCHGDAALMTPLHMPHDEEARWRRSVHGRRHAEWLASLAATGQSAYADRHPPTCIDCHADHGIGPRDRALEGCKRCHTGPWQSFQAGPHAKAFARMGFLPCVDCHGSHEITEVTPGLIGVDHDAACQRCHAPGQRMWNTIRTLATQVRSAERAAELARQGQAGVAVALLAARLRPIDEAQHALRSIVHTLDRAAIASAASELERRAAAVPRVAHEDSALVAGARSSWPALLLLGGGAALVLVALLRRRGGGA